jgi:hypothetical protein
MVNFRSLPYVPGRLELLVDSPVRSPAAWLYRPSKLLGVLALRLGLLSRVTCRPSQPVSFDLAEVLGGLGISAERVAVMRSPDRSQWTVGVRCVDGTEVIAKIGTGAHAASVVREFSTLHAVHTALSSTRLGAPRALAVVESGSLAAFSMERLPPSVRRPRFNLDEALDACVILADCGGRGVTHGDFTPWNVLDAGKLYVLDWERAADFVAGFDLAHYLLSSMHPGRLISGRELLEGLAPSGVIFESYALRTGIPLADIREGVLSAISGFMGSGAEDFVEVVEVSRQRWLSVEGRAPDCGS